MRKTLLTLFSFFGLFAYTSAQTVEKDGHEKRIQHHVGVQINELVRQVFNFSNNTNTNNNPYLLVYSINSVKKGWGGRVGIGYTYRSFTDDDGINRKETNINSVQLRLGIEKAFQLSGKWSTGIGIDGLYNSDQNDTRSTTKAFDTTLTVTTTKINSLGGGLMGWLRYAITDKVVIGTETSFYYLAGNQKQNITITSKTFGQQVTTTSSKVDNDVVEGIFRMPVAIYLFVRF